MSEVKLSCSVVRDLLPLYLDEVVEPETAAAVEAHLADCEACRDALERMRMAVPAAVVADPGQAGAKLMRKERKYAGIKTLTVTLATLLVGLFLWIGVTGWFPVVPVSAEGVLIESVQSRQDYCAVTFSYDSCWAPYISVYKDPDSGTVTITMRDTPYRFWGEKDYTGTYASEFQYPDQEPICQVIFNGEVVWSIEN